MINETPLATDIAKEKSEKMNQYHKELKNAFDTEKIIEVDVLEKVKGGFKVSYKDISLFIPVSSYTSQKDIKDEELSKVVGKKLSVKVREYIDEDFGKIINITHKEVAEDRLWTELTTAMKVVAEVKEIVPDKGLVTHLENGLRAFIPISHISRERIEDVESYISVGDVVSGEIIELNKSTGKIIVSLRNAPSKHLNDFFDTHNVGDKVKGKLNNIQKTRAYFTIAPNVSGSVKMSEVSWTLKNIKFNDFFEADKEYDFEIINMDRDNLFIDLSYKNTQPDNWKEITDKYEIGYTYPGLVVFIPPNGRGAYISVNGEIDGLMPSKYAPALYNKNKPLFKAKEVIQVKLVEKNEKTYTLTFESALKQDYSFDKDKSPSYSPMEHTGKNLSKPEVIKNLTLADLLSENSKKALK